MKRADLTDDDIARFKSRYTEGQPDECWVYQSPRSGNTFSTSNRKHAQVSKVAYLIAYGDLTAKFVWRTCAEPNCVNPAHMRNTDSSVHKIEGLELSTIKLGGDSGRLSASGVKGVYKADRSDNYNARVKFQGVDYYLGTFSSAQAAGDAYQEKVAELRAKAMSQLMEDDGYTKAHQLADEAANSDE